MKNKIRKILKEDRQEQFLNKIILLIKDEYPLFKKLKGYGFYDDLSEKELDYVLSGIFGEPVIKKRQRIYNQNESEVYYEDSRGYWEKYEYNENGKQIYYENYNGYWEKYEYNENGKQIYYENYNGMWVKKEYDENGKRIYFENNDGYWVKNEYDENGNIIYHETSDGYIVDNR